MKLNKNRKGFTLIELVIVLVILGILGAIAVPTYVNLRTTALENGLKSALGSVRSAVNLQHSKNLLSGSDTYPTLATSMFDEGEIPTDPINSSSAVATSSTSPLKGTLTGTTTGGWIYNDTTGEVRVNHEDYDDY